MNDLSTLISSTNGVALSTNVGADFVPLEPEMVPLLSARGRVLAKQVINKEPLPPFSRSTRDGYAVRASDTLGCSEAKTVSLTVVGEISMGSSGQISLQAAQAARIWTGGKLPQEADAVVMAEHALPFDDLKTVALFRPVMPGENVICAGEDYATGTVVLDRGKRLRPQDLGVLAALGIAGVPVYRRPRVAILSTGDELVAADQTPPPGKIRDINSTTLAALVEEAGGIAQSYGICNDNVDQMLATCNQAIAEADMLLVSGGSSKGQHDFTRRVFSTMPGTQLLVHNNAAQLGKSTIHARQGNKAIFGLPGHVASVLLVFTCLVRPILRQYSGLGASLGLRTVKAITSQQIPSSIGREDSVRVRLSAQKGDAPPLATPICENLSLLRPLIQADGLLLIGRDVEGLDKGAEVLVLLFP